MLCNGWEGGHLRGSLPRDRMHSGSATERTTERGTAMEMLLLLLPAG